MASATFKVCIGAWLAGTLKQAWGRDGSGMSSWGRHTEQRGGGEHSAWLGGSVIGCLERNLTPLGEERTGEGKELGEGTGVDRGKGGGMDTQLQGPRNGASEAGHPGQLPPPSS